MKRAFVTALFLSVLPLAAQQPAAQAMGMRMSEQREVTSASTALLASSIDLREDGTARTTHQVGDFSTRIELKGLTVREIVKLPVTEADAVKGITRRFHVKLACQAHRIWDGPMVAWSEWRESGYGFFPSTVVIEDVNGTLQASARRLKDFSPGIDGAMTATAK
jgi:hypothetical protein